MSLRKRIVAIARRARFTPRASSDRDAIFDYLRDRSPSGAKNVLVEISRAIDLLVEQPLAGPMTATESVRMFTLSRYPYRIFYRVDGDAIELLHIRHDARSESEFE